MDLPVERQADGRITAACRANLSLVLKGFVKRERWQARPQAICAVDARGVSLRRIGLPVASGTQFNQLLLLQLESEFPLPPRELAWGYRRLESIGSGNGSGGKQDLLVVAVKKEVIGDYSMVLAECGLKPVFTPGFLARNALCPRSNGKYAIVDLNGADAELAWCEGGEPTAARVLSKTKENSSTAELVTKALGPAWEGKLFVSGNEAECKELAGELSKRLNGRLDCEPLVRSGAGGVSATIAGLRKLAEENGGVGLLRLQGDTADGRAQVQRESFWKWALLAGALALGLLVWPYAEALALKPVLKRKFSALTADIGRLRTIDRELEFLQFLKQNQPPYLDALFIFSKAAPPGTKVDSVTMNRRGEISLRGSARDGQQVADFRSKLIASGFFSSVTLEEQTPTPDRQKVNIRMTATWKPLAERAVLSVGPTADEIERAKTNKEAQATTGMPMGMPMGGAVPAEVKTRVRAKP
jgi:hypothetical protein